MKKFFMLLCFFLFFKVFSNPVIENLDQRIKLNDTIVCCGLDPDPGKIPLEFIAKDLSKEEKVLLFLKEVVDITADHVCAYKIQKAFFDQFTEGATLLSNVIFYIRSHHKDIPIFLDCKIGDIGNTMQTYLHTMFDKYGVDGIVVNPYMGDDVFDAFSAYPQKVGIVLAQTSNQGALIVQNIETSDGKKLWRVILDLIVSRWNKNSNLIPVLSSVVGDEGICNIRESIPDSMPILFAGVGAQGGNPSGIKFLLDSNNRGIFVNSSRDILYPYSPEQSDWRNCIKRAILNFRDKLNKFRTEASKQKFLLLLGVSGAGKSRIIQELKKLDNRIVYISPYTTRALRPQENDKITISLEEMEQLEKQGQLLAINKFYGVAYGTPIAPIEKALRNGQIPVLDWPIDKLDIMEKFFGKNLFRVYIYPPDLIELQSRISSDGRDKDGVRFQKAKEELALFAQGAFTDKIDMFINNQNGKSELYACEILERLNCDK